MPTRNGKQTAAELRHGLVRFEKTLRERRDQAARLFHGLVAKGLSDRAARFGAEWAAYTATLDSLYTWTDGAFGEFWDMDAQPEPPAPEASGGEA